MTSAPQHSNTSILKTVLVSAYAVNPYHGSENGMGWNFVNQIARFNKVIAITRVNTRKHIECYMRAHPSPAYSNIQFVYYDLPYWMRFWKKGSRGALLYYYLWQFFMPRFVKTQKLEFDIVHNLNFHNDWTPSRLWMLRKPFVWGPIGHHPRIPKNYVLHVYGVRNYILEYLKWMTKKFFWNVDPMLRQTVQHADAVLTMNTSVANVLPLKNKNVFMMPSVSSENATVFGKKNQEIFTVLSAGRFVPLKGFDITVKSFARFYAGLKENEKAKTKLILVGDGPYKTYLQKLVVDLEIWQSVEFVEWLDREELKKLYANASAFLFPSHEGAGMVVAEALSNGLPVICFNNCGPGEFVDDTCGIRIPYTQYNESITDFANALHSLKANKYLFDKLSEGALQKFNRDFAWNVRGELLRDVYEQVHLKAS